MGKKKKKQRDSWDLTAEEQMELADAFYEAEKKGQLLKLNKDGKASKFTENGLEPGIEELIHQRLVASEHKNDENLTNNTNDESETFDESVDDFDNDEESENVESYESFIDKLSKNESYDVDDSEDDELSDQVTTPVSINTSNQIKFRFIEDLNRLVIDDGLVPTSISIDYVHSTAIKDMEYDDDYTGNTVSLLYYYILSTKHPYMILTKEEFVNVFRNVASYNTQTISLMEINEKYVAVYLVDKDTNEVLLDKIPEIYEFNNKEMLQYMLTIAINSGSIHNAFFYDQETYIEKFIDYTKSYTNLDDLTLLLNNSDTKFFDDSEDISERTYETLTEDLTVLDFESLREETVSVFEDTIDLSNDENINEEEDTDESEDEIINEEIDDLDEENEDFDDLLNSDDEEEEE